MRVVQWTLRIKHLGRRGWGGGGVFIQSEGKYELEWLKQFNVDKDERFI